jgi:hypothetical protein
MSLSRKTGNWRSDELYDVFGNEFEVGDEVAKAATSGRAVNIEIASVTRIENGKMWLSESKVAIHYPGRLVNLTKYKKD